MAEVFIAKRGSLTDKSKGDLRKAGVTVVEVDDLDDCRFVRSSEIVSADDMLFAALSALRYQGSTYSKGHEQREMLAVNLYELVLAARPKAPK